jgi:hypothetical protein
MARQKALKYTLPVCQKCKIYSTCERRQDVDISFEEKNEEQLAHEGKLVIDVAKCPFKK